MSKAKKHNKSKRRKQQLARQRRQLASERASVSLDAEQDKKQIRASSSSHNVSASTNQRWIGWKSVVTAWLSAAISFASRLGEQLKGWLAKILPTNKAAAGSDVPPAGSDYALKTLDQRSPQLKPWHLCRLQRYVLRLWLNYALAICSVLVFILLLLFASEVMGDIADGRLPISMLGWQIALHIPDAIRTVAPLGCMVAVLLACGQLQQDGEWSQLSLLGLDPNRRFQLLLRFGVGISLVLLILSSFIIPAAEQYKQHLFKQASASVEFWGLQAGRFTPLQEEDGIMYVAEMDVTGKARDVFVSWVSEQGEQVISSSTGNFRVDNDGERFVVMQDGRRTVTNSKGELQVLDFANAEVQLPTPAVSTDANDPITQFWPSLLGSNTRASRVESEWRLAHPIIALVLMLWSFYLLRAHAPHQGWSIVALVMVYVVYTNLLNVAKVWMARSDGSLLLGLWWVHLLFGAVAGWLVYSKLTGQKLNGKKLTGRKVGRSQSDWRPT